MSDYGKINWCALGTVAAICAVTMIVFNALAIQGELSTLTISCINTGVFGTALLFSAVFFRALRTEPDDLLKKITAFAIFLFSIFTLIGVLGISGVIHSSASIGWSYNATLIAMASFAAVVGMGVGILACKAHNCC